MIELCFQLVGDDNRKQFLHYVKNILCDNVVTEPLTLLGEVDGAKISGHFLQKVASAGASSILEPEVLKRDEPYESHQVGDYYVWTHQVKHSVVALDVV